MGTQVEKIPFIPGVKMHSVELGLSTKLRLDRETVFQWNGLSFIILLN